MRKYKQALAIAGTVLGCTACASQPADELDDNRENLGSAEIELTNAPTDAACLRVTVSGNRTDSRVFPLTPGKDVLLLLKGLPVGKASVSSDAFPVTCDKLLKGIDPTWYSEAKAVKISASDVVHVALAMIHNGRASVGIDFSDAHAPASPADPTQPAGTTSSQKAFLVAVDPTIKIKALLTTGDSANKREDGTPYRMAGLPDGLGAYDNGDGSFTLLSNHEMGSATTGIVRAHGAKGAFVSKWKIRKNDLAVLKGEDLMQNVALWNTTSGSFDAPITGVGFGRFCSADLPAPSALFDIGSGSGFDGRLFFDGEETGNEGRPMAHGLDGTSYEIARLGNMSYENIVANPGTGMLTVVAATDDSTPGQVYFYVGNKTSSGSPVDKAGLTNGSLYGLKVDGVPVEDVTAGIAPSPFSLFSFGNVESWTGARLETESNTALVTRFQRPEDGAWDPNNPTDFYFATTASVTTPSRLWRARFTDISKPELGGTIEMMLDGSEGQRMFDNITVDQFGHVYLVEDVGGNDRLGKVWRYDISLDTLTEIAHADPTLFDPTIMSPTFLTNDEEASGIIDASDVLGAGWLLVDVQNHKSNADPELVEGGQFLAIYDPAAAGL